MTATLTPYAAAKLVNEQLKKDGLDKKIPPQMMYTYTSKGYIPSTDKKIDEVDLMKWYVTYKAKLLGKSVPTDQVVPDNDGTVGEWA